MNLRNVHDLCVRMIREQGLCIGQLLPRWKRLRIEFHFASRILLYSTLACGNLLIP
jgi:hypothetical protein